jgi:hypothetical protein
MRLEAVLHGIFHDHNNDLHPYYWFSPLRPEKGCQSVARRKGEALRHRLEVYSRLFGWRALPQFLRPHGANSQLKAYLARGDKIPSIRDPWLSLPPVVNASKVIHKPASLSTARRSGTRLTLACPLIITSFAPLCSWYPYCCSDAHNLQACKQQASRHRSNYSCRSIAAPQHLG